MKLYISPTGEVTGVYDDKIPKEKLGVAKVERASNVEFNEAKQEWEAIAPDGSIMCSDSDRNKCLGKEKVIVEQMLKDSISSKP